MKYKNIFFDLDGTLTDSGKGIINSVKYSLDKTLHIDETDMDKLQSFIGPPLSESYKKCYGLEGVKIDEILKSYKEYYFDKGIYENKLYDGILDLLDELRNAGCKLYVATSKPQRATDIVIDHFAIRSYFEFVGAASDDYVRSTKAEVISYVIDECHIDKEDIKKTLMVGDRLYDILGARQNGLDTIGVLYGYGSKEELEEAGALYIAKDPKDIISKCM